MKQFFLTLAAFFGVVPASRYRSLVRVSEELRAGAQGWKQRAGEAQARVKQLEAELRRETRLTKEARRSLSKLQQQGREFDKLQEQLADTERELLLAREHLMAIEVKLDILEGAANVLDARTRTIRVAQPTETGAAR